MPSNLFVSYSHADGHLVAPIVKLLRLNSEFVFHDVDSIIPGEKWSWQINESIKKADLFVLFWCIHSSLSEEVMNEYQDAVSLNKNVLPVLLDTTPLPEYMSDFQWIDLQGLAKESHRTSLVERILSFAFKKREKFASNKHKFIAPLILTGWFVVGVLGLYQLFALLFNDIAQPLPYASIWFHPAIVLLLLLTISQLIQGRSGRESEELETIRGKLQTEKATHSQERMASLLESEILQRLSAKQ